MSSVSPIIDKHLALNVERIYGLKWSANENLGHLVCVHVHAGGQRPAKAGVFARERVFQGINHGAVFAADGVGRALALIGPHVMVGRADQQIGVSRLYSGPRHRPRASQRLSLLWAPGFRL